MHKAILSCVGGRAWPESGGRDGRSARRGDGIGAVPMVAAGAVVVLVSVGLEAAVLDARVAGWGVVEPCAGGAEVAGDVQDHESARSARLRSTGGHRDPNDVSVTPGCRLSALILTREVDWVPP